MENIADIYCFLSYLKEKDKEISEIEGMKEFYLKINELIDENDFDAIDNFIVYFINFRFSFQFHVALLASTLQVRQRISYRMKLVESTKKEGLKEMSESQLDLTLTDLI